MAAGEHISRVVAAIRGGLVTVSEAGHLLLPEGLSFERA